MPQVAPALATAASAAATFATTTFVGQLLTSVALSALSTALQRRSRPRPPGISTEVTTQGGVNPQSFILGRYATAGNEVCPPMSHDLPGGAPMAYLTYVHDLGDMPITGLSRLIVNDEYVPIGGTPHPDYGTPLGGFIPAGFAWIRVYDGTQTAADPMLVAKYGTYPDRPWSSDMIGRGIPYAILTFRFRRETFNALPRVRYEVDGLRLYDPRKDSTVGGSGAHRYSNPATWEFTTNPAVMIYNILRGITLPDGRRWGGECEAADLPLANWFAAMNVCDEAVSLDGGGTEPRYRAGLEVRVDQEPAEVIEELLRACSGQILETGGVWKMRAGGVGLPVRAITDDDIIVSDASTFTPFPSLAETYNAVHASYPDPEALWTAVDAPPRYSEDYEAADDNRRLVADLALPAVPYPVQVQRLMTAWVQEERRFRRHVLTLPPDASAVEPLDAITWTSPRNGYSAKVFEIAGQTDGMRTCNQSFVLRERDAGDYQWGTANQLPVVLPNFGLVLPPTQSVLGFGVTAVAIQDAAGSNRRPGLRFTWTTLGIDDVDGVQFEVRVQATGTLVSQPQTLGFASGALVTEAGLVGNTAYEVRARYLVSRRREVDWTAWVPVTTLNVGQVSLADLGTDVASAIAQASRVPAVLTLPADNSFFGDVVFLTTDRKIYRWTGSAWTPTVPAVDISGQITGTQIADSAISTPKLAANAVTADRIAANTITSGQLAANAVTAGVIQAGAIGAAAMAANAITAANGAIADLAVTTAKIANAAITNAKIGDLQVSTLKIQDNAVTITRSAVSSVVHANTGWFTLASLTFTPVNTVGRLGVWVRAKVEETIPSDSIAWRRVQFRVSWRGTIIRPAEEVIITATPGTPGILSTVFVDLFEVAAGAGSGTLLFEGNNIGSIGSGGSINSPVILCAELAK